MTSTESTPLQPLLSDAVIVLRAPTQVWSGRGGDIGAAAIDGVYHGDVRHVSSLELTCAGSPVEWISATPHGPSRVVFGGLLRGLDDPLPDPRVRLLRDRRVIDGAVDETLTVQSRVRHRIRTTIDVRLTPEFAPLHDVKSGRAHAQEFSTQRDPDAAAVVRSGTASFVVSAPDADIETNAGGGICLRWAIDLAPGDDLTVTWRIDLRDEAIVVAGVQSPPAVHGGLAAADPRLNRWLDTALGDLDALRLCLPDHPQDEFYAAGAPWFFTLFGRDSLWAARLALPLDRERAGSTLRVLARLQGSVDDPASAQEPGKILHELRSSTLVLPQEGVTLPPVYYGSVDATALWICLLVDAWRAGMPDAEVGELLPALDRALEWMTTVADHDGDGFLDYVDRTGHGLANQGWKDSGDSIQWRDGRLAEGPIALCEVQGYAYEAAVGAADLLDAFGPGARPVELRAWAGALKERFAASFWVQTPEGRYPAVALDRDKQAVDSLTSNVGHLLGTGILDHAEEAAVAELLLADSMSTGFGIRTMSTGAAGYWPLSYHGGSVWTHDTAIAARGMARAGLIDQARTVVGGLLAAAEGFGYRVPELHAGDPSEETRVPTPYPAACRPQAWSAAAAVACAEILAARV
ncbi:glycogen debranching N-terminal domain-containing protein [Microbacterium rhizomatis]|uniref:Amylo-alpha-1,6-glucosidase n=1 Tax=Microbacterium rhizomatis TaxID=1631477 RepID=A0A5J5IWY6_9MICO|nr:glycogen debranching N-terminal domain-containing protein [Microbacterium rhizomatis]KAA9105576.1 amylo-alpha-1,6-glucosidase [Microbacterium rhizomatis]